MDEMLDAKSYNQNKHSVDPGKVRSAKSLSVCQAQPAANLEQAAGPSVMEN